MGSGAHIKVRTGLTDHALGSSGIPEDENVATIFTLLQLSRTTHDDSSFDHHCVKDSAQEQGRSHKQAEGGADGRIHANVRDQDHSAGEASPEACGSC